MYVPSAKPIMMVEQPPPESLAGNRANALLGPVVRHAGGANGYSRYFPYEVRIDPCLAASLGGRMAGCESVFGQTYGVRGPMVCHGRCFVAHRGASHVEHTGDCRGPALLMSAGNDVVKRQQGRRVLLLIAGIPLSIMLAATVVVVGGGRGAVRYCWRRGDGQPWRADRAPEKSVPEDVFG